MNNDVEFSFGSKVTPVPLLKSEHWEWVRPLWKQVHGIKIAEVKIIGQECGEADGFWTQKFDVPISIVSADCIPVLLYRRDYEAVGALHVGWRGVLQHIAREFFKALPPKLAHPSEWCAVIGPSIRACCYEFGDLELDLIRKAFPQVAENELVPKTRMLNLLAPLESELRDLGVEIVSTHPDCTYCTKVEGETSRYFSFRRGDRNSRQYSIIQKVGEWKAPERESEISIVIIRK